MTHEGYWKPLRIVWKNITFSVWFTRLLRQQHAGEHLLARLGVLVRLEGEERLRLVL